MSYWIVAWISASVGFVLGAAWAGLGEKNQQIAAFLAGKRQRYYGDGWCEWEKQKEEEHRKNGKPKH